MTQGKLVRYSGTLLLVLLVNTAYIAAFASPTVFYMGNVVLHLILGLVLAAALIWYVRRMPVAGGLFLVAAALGVYLAIGGNTMPHRRVLEVHIVVAALSLLALLPYVAKHAGISFRKAYVACLVLLAVFPSGLALYRKSHPDPNDRIHNPPSFRYP